MSQSDILSMTSTLKPPMRQLHIAETKTGYQLSDPNSTQPSFIAIRDTTDPKLPVFIGQATHEATDNPFGEITFQTATGEIEIKGTEISRRVMYRDGHFGNTLIVKGTGGRWAWKGQTFSSTIKLIDMKSEEQIGCISEGMLSVSNDLELEYFHAAVLSGLACVELRHRGKQARNRGLTMIFGWPIGK